ncbi:MAG: MFS transporter [Fimbriimonadaceae bacterium]|nr:MFS transporter [Fimbriimonadaceae bacterium]
MANPIRSGIDLLRNWPAFRVFQHRDFRLLWFGALISFTGTQVQMVAQGAYVYHITGSKTSLGMVAFFSMIPVTFLSPIVGVLVDLLDRRKILIATSTILGLAAVFNATAASLGVLTFVQILCVALIGGLVQCVEPTSRQTIVREVVGEEQLAQAVPLQAMTFNLARAVGPALGGILTAAFGIAICFWVNAVSYIAILYAAVALRTRIQPRTTRAQPIKDLIFEGMLFTMRDRSLRMLFIMEGVLSTFGVPYIFQMPAIAKDLLHLNEAGLGLCYSSVGIGALIGLITTATISSKPLKTKIVLIAMCGFGVSMVALSFTKSIYFAAPALACLGAGAISQFNTTNTLFQLLSPPALRGRVLSMHMWAIAGLAPLGNLAMGSLADGIGLSRTLLFGGTIVGIGGIVAFMLRKNLREPDQ